MDHVKFQTLAEINFSCKGSSISDEFGFWLFVAGLDFKSVTKPGRRPRIYSSLDHDHADSSPTSTIITDAANGFLLSTTPLGTIHPPLKQDQSPQQRS
jgi:hypothetical protein